MHKYERFFFFDFWEQSHKEMKILFFFNLRTRRKNRYVNEWKEKGIIRTVAFQTINHDTRKGEEEAFFFSPPMLKFPWSISGYARSSSLWRIDGLFVSVELRASTRTSDWEREKTATLFPRFDPIKEEEPAFSLHEGIHKGTIDPPSALHLALSHVIEILLLNSSSRNSYVLKLLSNNLSRKLYWE